MPYIGRGSEGFGIRERYQYTATSNQTAFTGSDINSKTLAFDNGSLIDVLLNGVVLKPTTDYNTSTANTVTLVSGATTSDEVMIIVYDVFALSDAMPKTGGTFTGAVTHTGAFTSVGIDANADATSITIDSDENVGIGTASPDGALHVKGVSDHGRLVLESGGTSGSDNNMFMQFHNGGGTEIAQIAIEEGASNEGQLIFKTGGTTTAMTIDKDGHITKPLQSAFLVTKNATQSDIAESGLVTVTFETEIFDQNADFASNTFTAPVTGRYQLNATVRLQDLDVDAHYIYLYLVTSNRNYQSMVTLSSYDEDIEYLTLNIPVLADMDASDTAYVRLYLEGSGNVQVDVAQSESFFSGFLAC